eukprot:3586656-Amphidinium_carterae.1
MVRFIGTSSVLLAVQNNRTALAANRQVRTGFFGQVKSSMHKEVWSAACHEDKTRLALYQCRAYFCDLAPFPR